MKTAIIDIYAPESFIKEKINQLKEESQGFAFRLQFADVPNPEIICEYEITPVTANTFSAKCGSISLEEMNASELAYVIKHENKAYEELLMEEVPEK